MDEDDYPVIFAAHHYYEPSRRAPYSVDCVLRSQNEEHSVSEQRASPD
jgi:hypothetical protein